MSLFSVITACSSKEEEETVVNDSYGVFLGANDSDFDKIKTYKNILIDVDEFSSLHMAYFKEHEINVYAYLSVGSLEKYRPYYEEFKNLTFMDYDHWPDERWVDVSNSSWQNHIASEADRLKSLGATGLFMDNFDVYYIANEEYECSSSFREGIYNGCKSILSSLSTKDLKLIINSGTDFLERLDEEHNSLINAIDVYAQECVFSSIEDYDRDIFGQQDKETQDYYKDIINLMKNKSDILLIEYTKNESLKEQIKNYCNSNNFYYYISSTVDLKPTI